MTAPLTPSQVRTLRALPACNEAAKSLCLCRGAHRSSAMRLVTLGLVELNPFGRGGWCRSPAGDLLVDALEAAMSPEERLRVRP